MAALNGGAAARENVCTASDTHVGVWSVVWSTQPAVLMAVVPTASPPAVRGERGASSALWTLKSVGHFSKAFRRSRGTGIKFCRGRR